MKKILLTSVAVAAFACATPAFADDNTGTQTAAITVEGSTPAKCNIDKEIGDVNLAAYDLSSDNGRAKGNVGDKIANGLNALNMHAWCTGGANVVVLSRSSLQTGSTGGLTTTGFAQNIIYDVVLKVDGLSRENVPNGWIEATEDGTSGPTVGRFGPTGSGAKLTFDAFAPSGPSTATSVGGTGALPRSNYTPTDNRLAAGDYAGTITLTLTPGE